MERMQLKKLEEKGSAGQPDLPARWLKAVLRGQEHGEAYVSVAYPGLAEAA